MPAFHDIPQGDMYIEYSVVMPTAVSDGMRKSESGRVRMEQLRYSRRS